MQGYNRSYAHVYTQCIYVLRAVPIFIVGRTESVDSRASHGRDARETSRRLSIGINDDSPIV